MAIFDDGMLGGFRGKIGTVEGYLRKGIPVLRSRRKKSKKNKIGSPKQKAARQRIKIVNDFIGTLTPFVRVGFELQAADVPQTANNLAKSYQLLHSIQGEYPDLTIDYSKAVLTMGALPMPENIQVSIIADELHFSWDVNTLIGWPLNTDQVMMVACSPQTENAVYIMSGARRNTGHDAMDISMLKKGFPIETYISFIADDRKSIATSIYTGQVNW